jgi:CRISPR system Cascade subunit CasD
MTTLLLRLAGPMQSWGTLDRFSVRFTGREPSKSGVIGVLCAALGRGRDVPVDDLGQLTMGVRVDAEGTVGRDYQTAGGTHRRGDAYGVRRASGAISKDAVVSTRYFLADADFLVGLEGPEPLLRTLDTALRAPAFPLFLGRKAFVPGVPVSLPASGGVRAGASLREALAGEPWPRPDLVLPPEQRRPQALRVVLEQPAGSGGEARMDQPAGAAFRTRSFGPRYIRTEFFAMGTDVPVRSDDVSVTSHP